MTDFWKRPASRIAAFALALLILIVTVSLLGTSKSGDDDEYSEGPLICQTDSASTTSTMFSKTLSDIALQTLSAEPVMMYDRAGEKLTVLISCSYRCPCSDGYGDRLTALKETYEPLGVAFVALHSNVDETMDGMKSYTNRKNYPLEVLRDEGAVLADELSAAVTPEAFVFNTDWELQYHGRIDDDKGGLFVSEKSLQLALDTLLTGKPLEYKEKIAMGCAIVRNPS
jgi:hypothetical protein